MSEAQAALIQARGLSIGFGGRAVISGIDFDLPPGQALALIGTNGSGKSTLLKTLVGLLPSLSGEVKVLGGLPGAQTRRIAYLGQCHTSGFVLPLRTVDVVRMGRFPRRGLLGRMGSEDEDAVRWAMRIMGIEALSDRPLRTLSGGQQQRTYLAQALAHQADILVLDEPTSGLDAGGRELYLHAVTDELRRGASMVAATHDIHEEAALCQQVMLLARKVVAVGPLDKVLTPDALRETFGIVLEGEHRPAVLECRHGHDGG
ncbi:MAG: metal ABC transporter ATP-binding protein [Dehalococcoidia bacterium]|nr:metal ABC transporter ATP-binding protein [Dehalococcoidia bacterium]